jgi:hypothetical protein
VQRDTDTEVAASSVPRRRPFLVTTPRTRPRGTETATATMKEYPASSRVAGSRCPITCDTGMPESIDVPNRPVNRFCM